MTTRNDRQRQAEAEANKYCDENFTTQHHDEYWENKSSYLKGWRDADSTPPPQVDDGWERAVKMIAFAHGKFHWSEDLKTLLLQIVAEARRAQNAEVERLVNLLKCFVEDNECRLDHHGGCQEHMFLSLEHNELCPNKEALLLIKDYERMKGGEG